MSMLPEEFPLVLTVFMVMGAWRISRAAGADPAHRRDRDARCRHRAVHRQDRHADAEPHDDRRVTANRRRVLASRASGALPDRFRALLECGILASAPTPFDPMEKAFHALGAERLQPKPAPPRAALAMGIRAAPGSAGGDSGLGRSRVGRLIVAAKGAPEAIAELCRLGPAERAAMQAALDEMSRRRHAGARRGARLRWRAAPTGRSRRAICVRVSPGSSALPIRCGPAVAGRGARMPRGRHPRRHDHRGLSADRRGDRRRRPGIAAARSSPAAISTASTMRSCGSGSARRRSSPASCPSRNCASSRR